MSCICNLFKIKRKNSKVNSKVKKLNIYDLNKADNNIPLFSLDGTQFKAKVVNVYDGDTIKVVIIFNNKLTRFNIRMSGYDSPELRTKDEEEKKAGIIARDVLKNKILNKIVDIHCGKFDKYGRLLGYIYYNKKNINDWMISNKYGYVYNGGTKQKFTSK